MIARRALEGISYLTKSACALLADTVISWSSRGKLSFVSDGQIKITNSAGTQGVVIDVSSSALTVRNLTLTAKAVVNGLSVGSDGAFYGTSLANGSGWKVTFYAGAPEGAVIAGPGSVCSDTTNGELYIKNTGTGNTGWKLITRAP